MYFNKNVLISLLWLVFFTLIFFSWLHVYNMSLSMGLNWSGKKVMPMEMQTMNMSSMISLKMLFLMWSIMPFLNMILLLLSSKAIRKDEDLIRSIDRLR